MGDGLTTALTFVWDGFATAVTTFNTYPVLWLGAAIGIAGALISLVKRAVRVGGRRR